MALTPSPIAGYRTTNINLTKREVSDFDKSRIARVGISPDKLPPEIIAYPNLPITSDAETLAEYLDILKACNIVPEIDSNHEFALMPAIDLGFSLTIGKEDKTNWFYRIADKKKQIPMILVSRPKV